MTGGATNGYATTPGVVQPAWAGGTCYEINSGPPVPPTFYPCPNTFIAKFDPKGRSLFLTYLGGIGSAIPASIALDSSGNIYVGGQVEFSTDFPLAGTPWRPVLTPNRLTYSFLAKLSNDGTKLIWSTVVNGGLIQLALAPDGSIYFLVQTNPPDQEATLTQLTADGQFVTSVDVPLATEALAVGADGSVYFGGYTDGTDIKATPGAWQTKFGGSTDGFVAKMNASLSGFVWLTFVGGSSDETVGQIQLAPDGSIWVLGETTSSNFPVLSGAFQTQPAGYGGTGYALHLSADGTKALASTYVPEPTSIILDSSGNAIISAVGSGLAAIPGVPWPCWQPNWNGNYAKLDPAGQHLLWASWAGPSVPVGPIAVDKNGNLLVAGLDLQSNLVVSTVSTTPGPPRLVDTCIVQSGYPYAPGPLAPGEIISIYGAGFGPAEGVAAQASENLIGTELAGVQVLIENTPAPLLYVSSTQINLVTPFMLDGRIAAHIKIVTPSATSNEAILGVQRAAPEIFVVDVTTAAILNQDGTVNGPDHPAHVGETVSMFVSGLGQTNPPGVDGAIAQAAGGTPVLPVSVQLSPPGVTAKVTYAGNAPGLVAGTSQVNFEIPELEGAGSGQVNSAELTLSASDFSTVDTFQAGLIALIYYE